MKKYLLFIAALLIMVSCEDEKDEKVTLDNSMFGIEKIIINGKGCSLKDSSFFIDKEEKSSLYLSGSGFGSNYMELYYDWISLTEKLSSVSAVCTKGTFHVEESQISSTRKFVLIFETTSPVKAQMRYIISGLAN